MSTRALRKLQREQEEARQLAALEAADDDEAEGDDSPHSDEAVPAPGISHSRKKKAQKSNAFQMLNQEDAEEVDADGSDAEDDDTQIQSPKTPNTVSKRKKKRKQKTRVALLEPAAQEQTSAAGSVGSKSQADEIDRALEELDLRKQASALRRSGDFDESHNQTETSWESGVSKLLAIDSKRLNPTNEMRSLFGSVALEAAPRNQTAPEEGGRVDLETALTGRHSPVSRGKELGSLAKRRNVFMQGQESWPLATSGGLGMEAVKDEREADTSAPSATTVGKQYHILHNAGYRETQYQFRRAVESMSAENMIHLLVYNPYHIATLLQVAEIAKHQGDHFVTSDLLERALFAFGRSVHSTFGVSIREGLARLTFSESASRDLYLTIWRYIQTLEMRGTWRTAFEWSKILLSFNILSDPFGITHSLDQYALRARQHDTLIALCTQEAFGRTWSHLPNMQLSLGLAYHRAGQPKLARQTLALATHRYPYIVSHLCSTLEIFPLPKSLWGITPSTDAEKLFTELYVTRAKDLWTTPETKALLAEVADTLDSYSVHLKGQPPAPKLEVSLEDARHIILLDIPSLIALIPRNFRSLPTAQYDVLPPPSSAEDAGLTARAPADIPAQGGVPSHFLHQIMRAVSDIFLGNNSGGGDSGRANTSTNDDNGDNANTDGIESAREPEPTDQGPVTPQNFFNMTLADANLDEEDRAAILAALAESEDSESDADVNEPSAPQRNEPESNAATNRQSPDQRQDNNATITDNSSMDNMTATPHHATVESDSESHPDPQSTTAPSQQQPSQPQPAQPPQSQSQPQSQPQPQPQPQPQTAHSIQRHLLTTGLTALLQPTTITTTNNNNNNHHHHHQNPNAMHHYTSQLKLLTRREREWTLGMVGQRIRQLQVSEPGRGQGAGSSDGGGGGDDAAELVQRIRSAVELQEEESGTT